LSVDLSVYLMAPGKVPSIGQERGKRPSGDGIGKYTSPHGSVRYVAYIHGQAKSALQVVTRDWRHAVIANVYTLPDYRRMGLATTLIKRARRDFKSIDHASEANLSDEGRAWRDST
jgi:GNAT superfamily N-acetyltransferase